MSNEQHMLSGPEIAAERDRLKEINAELLEALNALVSLHHDWYRGSAYVTVAFEEKNKAAIASARAAIAKASG